MNIRKCGKNNHRDTETQRAQSKIFILFFLCGLLFSLCLCGLVYAGEIIYAAGRGTEKNGTIWKYMDGTWSVHSEIPGCSEVFSLVVDNNGILWVGGNYFGYGKVWRYNGKEWDNGTVLPECRGLYSLTVEKNGNLWAGGAGAKNIWRYDGIKWDNGTELKGCTGIYSLAVDLNGNIWAGGEGKGHVWYFNGRIWDNGAKLSDCTEVFSLFVDTEGIIWAGGRGGKVLWWLKQGKWAPGTILLDSTEISAFTQDATGQLYATGAGRNKVWVKKTETDWLGVNLNNCIAIYTILTAKDKVVVGGWNSERKGRIWEGEKENWSEGIDIDKCYVIRSIARK